MKIYVFRNGRKYYAKIEDKIYLISKELLHNIAINHNNLEILTVAVNRSVKARILSEFLRQSDTKKVYEKRILNPNGYLSFGIIIGDNLNTDSIPFEIKTKKHISQSEWNKYVKGNIFKEKEIEQIEQTL